MAEDPGLEIVKAGAEGFGAGLARPVVDAARRMAAAVLGDTVEALDDRFSLRLAVRNEQTRQQLIERLADSYRLCDEAGIDPGEVGLKLGQAIFANAGLEEDPDMQARWAALIANASAGELGASVFTSFPEILTQLEPVEARILDELTRLSSPDTVDVWGLRMALGLDSPEESIRVGFLAHLGNLERLGLAQVRWPSKEIQDVVQFLQRERYTDPFQGRPLTVVMKEPQLPQLEQRELVTLTELGRAFVRACTPPASLNNSD